MSIITLKEIETFIAPIKIDLEREGKYILENAMYFGGGVRKISRDWSIEEIFYRVMHELGHFIEIDDARALCHTGWNFQYGTYTGSDHRNDYYSFFTDTHLQREIRVYAIQSQLSQHLGMNFDTEESILLLRDVLSGFRLLPGNSEDEKVLLAIAKVETLRQQPEYGIAALMTEFERKKELFQVYSQTL
jgi:hypothetical protein